MKDLKPTMKNAILSHCHECLGHYSDGKTDCRNPGCQFYLWFPYKDRKNPMEPSLEWTRYHPRRVGKHLLSECGPSEEESKVIADRLAEARKKK